MNATTIPASGLPFPPKWIFTLEILLFFYAEDREQGRVTDRDRGHQVLANDRRGKGEGEQNFREEMLRLSSYLLIFKII